MEEGDAADGLHALYAQRTAESVRASLRVDRGEVPHAGFDPNPDPFELALRSLPRARVLTEAVQAAAIWTEQGDEAAA